MFASLQSMSRCNGSSFLIWLKQPSRELDYTDQLVLELTYRAAQPHITSFVRVLHRPKPIEAIRELDQYVVARDQDHDKIWKHANIKLQAQ